MASIIRKGGLFRPYQIASRLVIEYSFPLQQVAAMNFRRLCTTLLPALVPPGFPAAMVVALLFTLAAYDSGGTVRGTLQDGYMRHKVGWAMFQVAAACMPTVLTNTSTGQVLVRLDLFGRGWILRLLMPPFVIPTLVTGIGVLVLFGAHGALRAGWQDMSYLLLCGNMLFNLLVLACSAYQGFTQALEVRFRMTRTLGVGAWRRFTDMEWPVLRP